MLDSTETVFVSVTPISRTFSETAQTIKSSLTEWKVLMRTFFWVLCRPEASERSSPLFSVSLITPTVGIVMWRRSSINNWQKRPFFFSSQHVSLWSPPPQRRALWPSYRHPLHSLSACPLGLHAVVVVSARAADTNFFCGEGKRAARGAPIKIGSIYS